MKCARCGRLWYADYDTMAEEPVSVSLHLELKGANGQSRVVDFDALCDVCVKTLVNCVDQIDREMKKASPNWRKPRAKKKSGASV